MFFVLDFVALLALFQNACQDEAKVEVEEKVANELRQKTNLDLDEMIFLYDRPFTRGETLPSRLECTGGGTLYIVPSPASSRGLPQRAVSVLRGTCTAFLEKYTTEDTIMIGLGHEADLKADTVAKLQKINEKFDSCTWKLVPITEQTACFSYVEYILVGTGASVPGTITPLSWVGPVDLTIDMASRIPACMHEPWAPPALDSSQGQMLCRACEYLRERHGTKVSPKPKKKASLDDDLLGGKLQADSDDEHSSISGDDTPQQADNSPQQEKKKMRPARQGMCMTAWAELLKAISPAQVVLVSPLTFQAGLIQAILNYNSSRVGLPRCVLTCFTTAVPAWPADHKWTPKARRRWQSAHLSWHTLQAAIDGYTTVLQKTMVDWRVLCA